MKRPTALILVGVAVAAVLAFSRPPDARAATDRLPDLGMARVRDLSIDTTTLPGHRLLRFTTIIVNIGAGPFETIGSRHDAGTSQMAAAQRIYNTAGASRVVNTPAVMFWAGDGHDHWHVRDAEAYRLTRLDNGRRVGTGAKHGFCYFDNTPYRLGLADAPTYSIYGGCGVQGDLRVTTGLSVGWGDTYPAGIAYQWIDITGLKSGRYRLRHRRPGQLVRRDQQHQQQHLDQHPAHQLRGQRAGLRASRLTSRLQGKLARLHTGRRRSRAAVARPAKP